MGSAVQSLGEVYSKRQSLQLGHPDSGLPASPSCLSNSTLTFCTFLTLLVVDADHHGEGGAKRNDPTDRVCPRSFPMLDLHPAVHVVPCNYDFL